MSCGSSSSAIQIVLLALGLLNSTLLVIHATKIFISKMGPNLEYPTAPPGRLSRAKDAPFNRLIQL